MEEQTPFERVYLDNLVYERTLPDVLKKLVAKLEAIEQAEQKEVEADRLKHLKIEDLTTMTISQKWSNKTLMEQYLSYKKPPEPGKMWMVWK